MNWTVGFPHVRMSEEQRENYIAVPLSDVQRRLQRFADNCFTGKSFGEIVEREIRATFEFIAALAGAYLPPEEIPDPTVFLSAEDATIAAFRKATSEI